MCTLVLTLWRKIYYITLLFLGTVDCRPINVRELVERVNELEIMNRIVLPMYGLAVEVVKARRRR